MKKQLLTVLACALSGLAFGQTIQNGNFENWTTTTVENPQFWMCANFENSNNGITAPPAVTKTTDAYHGAYAIKLSSSTYGPNGDTAKAWVADGSPGSNVTGGVPYAQTPTGMRFYYKLSLAPTDTAITLAIFKKNGSVIGQYFFKIGVDQTSYTLFSGTFSPALTQAPDTVVFACAASNLMATKQGLPGSTFIVDSVSFTGVSSQPANFNGDFELWQNDIKDNLLGWNVDKRATKTTDKYKGTYAVELITNPPGFGNSQIEVGRINNTKNSNSGPPTGGWPFTNQSDTLVFYYKYLPANYPSSTDSALANLSFYKNGANIGGGQMRLGFSLNYKKVIIPFNLFQAPDTVQISFESSNWPAQNSYVGSDLKVDQVYFKSQVIPISSFSIPATGCKGIPIQLMDNSTNMPTSWQWFMTGASPFNNTTLQNPLITYTNTGTFNVSLQAADSFGTGALVTQTIIIYNNPVVTASSATVCGGSTATLNANGASTYTWNTGATGATYTVAPNASTTYTVVGTSTVGCSGTNTGSVFVPVPLQPDICMVTVDSITNLNNIITWDKTLYNNADSFIVHREVSTGIYSRIGAVSRDSISLFIDTARQIGPANGDPNIGSYRYKIQIRDTCGNYGALSKYHNTVKITDQHNGTFLWNSYDIEGQGTTPVANFILERDNANTNVWTTVGIVSGTQLTAFDGSYSTYQAIANWRVQATGFGCTPSLRYGNNGTQAAIVKSKSNISNNRTTGILKNNIVLGVHPNPSNGIFTITLAVTHATADVYDLTGKKVAAFNLEGNTSQIDLSDLSNGSYFLNVKTEKGVYHQKINKTN